MVRLVVPNASRVSPSTSLVRREQLVTGGSLVFGDIEGQHRNPEHVSRQFIRDVERFG
jgi:hypothetical protein